MAFNNKARLLTGTRKKLTLKHFNKMFSAFAFETLLCGLETLTEGKDTLFCAISTNQCLKEST